MADGITELPSGKYRWRIQVNGRRVTGSSGTLAEARLARAQAAMDVGALPESDPTVSDLIGTWLAQIGDGHAATTAQRRDIALDAIPDAFKQRQARQATPQVIAALWRQMADAGTGAHTILKASHALSRAYRLGIEYGLVASNPVAGVRPKVGRPRRISPPSPDDVRRLLEHLRPSHDIYAWATFMAVVGARPGEVCALRHDGIDQQAQTVYVGPSVDRHGNITHGKNGPDGHRVVKVTARLLLELRGVSSVPGSAFVFARRNGQPWRPEYAPKLIAAAADELGINMRPYDLRHFAVTQALAAGRPVPEVAYQIGDNPATVMKVYAHAIPSESRSVEAVEQALFGRG